MQVAQVVWIILKILFSAAVMIFGVLYGATTGKHWISFAVCAGLGYPLIQAIKELQRIFRAGAISGHSQEVETPPQHHPGLAEQQAASAQTLNEADRYLLKADAHIKLGEYERAMRCLNAAISASPDGPVPLMVRAAVWRAMLDYDAALRDLTEAVRVAPNSAGAHIELAETFYVMKKYDELESELQRAIELNPNAERAYELRARFNFDRKNYEQAIADADRAIDVGGEMALAHAIRGISYLRLGNEENSQRDIALSAKCGDKEVAEFIESSKSAEAQK